MTNLPNPSVPILRKSNTKLCREARHQLKTLVTPTSNIWHLSCYSYIPHISKDVGSSEKNDHIRSLQGGIPSPGWKYLAPANCNQVNKDLKKSVIQCITSYTT